MDGVTRQANLRLRQEVRLFCVATGMTMAEIAQETGLKVGTLYDTLGGKVPGHKVVPAVRDFIDGYRNRRTPNG